VLRLTLRRQPLIVMVSAGPPSTRLIIPAKNVDNSSYEFEVSVSRCSL